MTLPRFWFLPVLAALAPAAVHSAEATVAAPAPEPLHAMASFVEDNRSTTTLPTTGCRIALTFVGDEAADTYGVLAVHVTKAVDDTGRDLVLPPEGGRFVAARSLALNLSRARNELRPATMEVRLRNPARRATVIKQLEGSADLFRPTEANGAIVTLPGALAQRGPVKSPALEKLNLELKYLTAEETARVRPGTLTNLALVHPDSEEEQRRLDAVAEEVSRRRALREAAEAGGGAPATALPPSTATTSTAPSPTGHTSPYNRPFQYVSFEVKDPAHKVVAFDLRDAKGEALPVVSSSYYDGRCRFVLREAPPADAQLIVYLETPESVQSRPFALENIALP